MQAVVEVPALRNRRGPARVYTSTLWFSFLVAVFGEKSLKSEFLIQLIRNRAGGVPDVEQVRVRDDLDLVREVDEFKALMAEYCSA